MEDKGDVFIKLVKKWCLPFNNELKLFSFIE